MDTQPAELLLWRRDSPGTLGTIQQYTNTNCTKNQPRKSGGSIEILPNPDRQIVSWPRFYIDLSTDSLSVKSCGIDNGAVYDQIIPATVFLGFVQLPTRKKITLQFTEGIADWLTDLENKKSQRMLVGTLLCRLNTFFDNQVVVRYPVPQYRSLGVAQCEELAAKLNTKMRQVVRSVLDSPVDPDKSPSSVILQVEPYEGGFALRSRLNTSETGRSLVSFERLWRKQEYWFWWVRKPRYKTSFGWPCSDRCLQVFNLSKRTRNYLPIQHSSIIKQSWCKLIHNSIKTTR